MRGILVVTAIAAIVGAGLAAAYFWIWQPRADDRAMKAEVETLAESWKEVRRCLLGAEPASSDAFEALMVRELTGDDLAGALAGCQEPLKAARRGAGFNTGNPEVEKRWRELREARQELATAVALRAARRPVQPLVTARRRLADAAAAAEKAYAALRQAAGLEADPIAGEPLPRPEPESIDGVSGEVGHLEVDGNQVLAIAAKGGSRLVVVAGAGNSRRVEVPGPATAAIGGEWAAWVEPPVEEQPEAIRIFSGAIEGGALPSPTPVAELRGPADAEIAGALGDGRGRRLVAVVERPSGALHLFESSDGGARWDERPSGDAAADEPPRLELFPLAGRLVVSRGSSTRELSRADLSRVASYPFLGTPCFGPRRSWWLMERGLVSALPGESPTPVPGSEDLPFVVRACSDTQLLGVGPVAGATGRRRGLRICRPTGCELSAIVPYPASARAAAVIAPIGGPTLAFESEGVVVLWRVAEDGKGLRPRAAARLPEGAALGGLVEWNGALEAVIQSGDSVALAALSG